MDIYSYLHKDHEKVKSLMNEIDGLGNSDSPQKEELFNELKHALLLHAKAEEEVFYDRIESQADSADVRGEVEHAKEEHAEAETLLEELTSASLNGSAWQQKFRKLKESVEHHIKEEETEVFDDAHQMLSDRESDRIGEEMKERKQQKERTLRIEDRHAA